MTGRWIALLVWIAWSGCVQVTEPGAGDGCGTGGQPATGAGSAATAPRRLRIATWNLQYLHDVPGRGTVPRRERDYQRLRQHAAALAADIVAVQEVRNEAALARVFDPAQYALHVAQAGEAQRVGFAVRRGIPFTPQPDLEQLVVGSGMRSGADIAVPLADGQRLRLLSVHLASGCFDGPLAADTRACSRLGAQLPVVEAWLDARAADGQPAIVAGDFNRRFFARPGGDLPWRALDDGTPPASDLFAPTEGQRARCWNARYPVFIDHLVLNLPATRQLRTDSFQERIYPPNLTGQRAVLSDHCPLSVELQVSGP